jgi:hypothetical protein
MQSTHLKIYLLILFSHLHVCIPGMAFPFIIFDKNCLLLSDIPFSCMYPTNLSLTSLPLRVLVSTVKHEFCSSLLASLYAVLQPSIHFNSLIHSKPYFPLIYRFRTSRLHIKGSKLNGSQFSLNLIQSREYIVDLLLSLRNIFPLLLSVCLSFLSIPSHPSLPPCCSHLEYP